MQISITAEIRRLTFFGATLLLLLAETPTYAEAPEAKRDTVDIHGLIMYFNWQEDVDSDIDLEESGLLYGVGFSGDSRLTGPWSSHYRGQVYFGVVDYDGFLQGLDGSITPYESETSYAGIVADLDGSYNLSPNQALAWRPFAGLGARYWLRSLDNSGGFGYDEYWLTVYGRVGLRLDYDAPDDYQLFFSAAATLPFYNDETAKNVPFSSKDIDLEPKEKTGYHVEAGWRRGTWVVVAFYEFLNFGQSDLDSSGFFYQPASENYMTGLRVGYVF